jgi:16S rRNA (guanine527-N7)-methyltransferase
VELLLRGARELGLVLTPEHLAAFERYQVELLDWNQRFNLTAITDPAEVQVKHFLDSLTCLLAIAPRGYDGLLDPAAVSGRAIDVGAGAGFPGVALKIACPGLRLTLLESVRKKAGFLSHLVAVLGLEDVDIVPERAEDFARRPGRRDGYDFALARALAPMPVLLEYCLPFVRPGGRLVAPKKGDLTAELAAARDAVRVLGGRWREPVQVTSSLLPDARVLVVVEKVAPTPKAYPRRAGIPAKQPLGNAKG